MREIGPVLSVGVRARPECGAHVSRPSLTKMMKQLQLRRKAPTKANTGRKHLPIVIRPSSKLIVIVSNPKRVVLCLEGRTVDQRQQWTNAEQERLD